MKYFIAILNLIKLTWTVRLAYICTAFLLVLPLTVESEKKENLTTGFRTNSLYRVKGRCYDMPGESMIIDFENKLLCLSFNYIL